MKKVFPCKDCITLPICLAKIRKIFNERNDQFNSKRKYYITPGYFTSVSFYMSSCKLLTDYIQKSENNYVAWNTRKIDKVEKFYKDIFKKQEKQK